MARGWESKDVEARREARNELPSAPDIPPTEKERRRNQIELDRTRVMRELQSACHPRFRCQLEAELAHLEAALRELDA
jgi:hypothetical protein